MRWDYFDISLVVGGALILYILVFFTLRFFYGKGWMVVPAIGLLLIHLTLAGTVLSFPEQVKFSEFGFEVWVCDKSVELKKKSLGDEYGREPSSYIDDRYIKLKGQEGLVNSTEALESAGVDVSDKEIGLPVSRDTEFNLSTNASLESLRRGLVYEGSGPYLKIAEGGVNCSGDVSDVWNIYIARVSGDSFEWERYDLNSFNHDDVKLNAIGGSGRYTSDCVLMEYGSFRSTPRHTCYEILKNNLQPI